MRWVIYALRWVFVLAATSLTLVAPESPAWQVIAGIAYPIGVLELLRLLDADLDIVDLALHGLSGRRDSPLRPSSLLGRLVVLFLFWFVVVALGLLFDQIPIYSLLPMRQLSPVYFLAGTIIGAALYLAGAGWYRRSMRRRYGY